MKSPAKNAADEIVWGCAALAKVIHRSDRQTYHLLEHGTLPAKKVRGVWVGGRERLIAFLIDGEVRP
jgi:hypothetical protein